MTPNLNTKCRAYDPQDSLVQSSFPTPLPEDFHSHLVHCYSAHRVWRLRVIATMGQACLEDVVDFDEPEDDVVTEGRDALA